MKFFLFIALCLSGSLFAKAEIPFMTFQNATLSFSKPSIVGKGKEGHLLYYPVFSYKSPKKIKPRQFLSTMNPLSKVKKLDGELLVIVDDAVGMVSHYFHFMEHLIGISNFLTYKDPTKVKLILFAFKSRSDKDRNWKGLSNDTTRLLLNSYFPKAKIALISDFPSDWKIKAKKIHISSRTRSHGIQACAYNNMNGSSKPFYKKENLCRMRDEVFKKMGILVEPRKEKFRVTYCKRLIGRTLLPEIEKDLLNALEKEVDVALQVVDFASLSFKEQLQIIANTDLLMGVHGNGLTHLLFLPDQASVIEYFEDGESSFFRLFAQVRGVSYFGNSYQRWITGKYQSLENKGSFQDSVKGIDREGTLELIRKIIDLGKNPLLLS